MALFAFDGTWNEGKTGDANQNTDTNVFRFFEAYQKNSGTHDYYLAGVGTRFDIIGRALGGVFGLGELARLDEAYAHLCQTWAAGDHVIDIVGFSRGAATTLDFCHLLQERGIRSSAGTVVEPHAPVRFLGVWDVVGAFGLANLGNTALNIGHHLEIPARDLQYCFHALALDERRLSFLPIRLDGAHEVWFRGVHSDIGGGNGNVGLNDITLRWMMRKAQAAHLPITEHDISTLKPDPNASPKPAIPLPFGVRVVAPIDWCHYTVQPSGKWENPPQTCPVETVSDERTAEPLGAAGLTPLPVAARARVLALWDTAQAAAIRLGAALDQVKDPLLNLFQARVVLVTSDQALATAERSVVELLTTAADLALQRGYHEIVPFFLNEALFARPHLFPFTD